MTISFPEVFVSHTAIAKQVNKAIKKGLVRKLGGRVYTTNFDEEAEMLIKRHVWFIIRELFPGSIIVDRTALEHRPTADGSVFIVSKKRRPVFLPGLSIYPRKGHEPLEEDRPFMSTLFLASPARAYLENLCVRRSRKGTISRTLSRKEIEERLELLLQRAGSEALQTLRDEAKKIAPKLGLEKEFKILNGIIGTLLGTNQLQMNSPMSIARAQGQPYDSKRLDLFQKLYEALANNDTPLRNANHPSSALPFFESYFSNFIEGTEFQVEEAAEIIFEGKIPLERPKDAHDILGTYQIVSDLREMKKCPQTADELLTILKKRHALLMHQRPEINPGEFKTTMNRAGGTTFVLPDLVEGTLRKGFEWLQGLNSAFKRAVFMMFLIAEVHPFTDGNGRCARIMMNAELVAADQARIIIPTIFRNNYISALKALSHQNRPEALIRSLDFAQHFTSLIDWSDFDKAYKMLKSTHAFEDSNVAESAGMRLILPL